MCRHVGRVYGEITEASGPSSWLCNGTGSCSEDSSTLVLKICCCYLEISNNFKHGTLNVHFVLGLYKLLLGLIIMQLVLENIRAEDPDYWAGLCVEVSFTEF